MKSFRLSGDNLKHFFVIYEKGVNSFNPLR